MKTAKELCVWILVWCGEDCTRDKQICISGSICACMSEIALNAILGGEY